MYTPSLRKDEFFKIHIKHLATSNKVKFEGWVTEFADNFSSTWNSTPVYGRMDPLVTFQNTKRDIKLSFDVVSDSKADARANLVRINELISFLYPVYKESSRGVQSTLNAAPLIGLRWTNLINNSAGNGPELIGYLDGINYAPDMGEGGFIFKSEGPKELLAVGGDPVGSVRAGSDMVVERVNPRAIAGRPGSPVEDELIRYEAADLSDEWKRNPTGTGDFWTYTDKNTYIPKKISLSFNFTVLHTHMVGWNSEGVFGPNLTRTFPNAVYVKEQHFIGTDEHGKTVSDESAFENDSIPEPATLWDQLSGALSGTE